MPPLGSNGSDQRLRSCLSQDHEHVHRRACNLAPGRLFSPPASPEPASSFQRPYPGKLQGLLVALNNALTLKEIRHPSMLESGELQSLVQALQSQLDDSVRKCEDERRGGLEAERQRPRWRTWPRQFKTPLVSET